MKNLKQQLTDFFVAYPKAGEVPEDIVHDILYIIRDYVEKMNRWDLQWESMSLNKYGDYLDYVEVMEALGWKG